MPFQLYIYLGAFVTYCDPILVFMSQMPRIWLDYCSFLMEQGKVTRTRQTMDRALRALPITQHNRIWPLYIKFVRLHDLKETAVRVYRRYLKVKQNSLTLWMLSNFLKIDYIVVCFLKPLNSVWFLWEMMDKVANRLDLRPAAELLGGWPGSNLFV